MVGDGLDEEYIHTASFVVGLLPLRFPRWQQLSVQQQGHELIADPRYGMPDARDLLALLLCVDAAIRGKSRMTMRTPVSTASLLRIAGMRLQLSSDARSRLLSVARDCSFFPPSIELTADWCAWGRLAPRFAALPWTPLQRVTPGAQMLAVALATLERSSIAMDKLAARCGCQASHGRNARQRVKLWLAELYQVGLDAWAIDRDRAVVFRKAQLDGIRPCR